MVKILNYQTGTFGSNRDRRSRDERSIVTHRLAGHVDAKRRCHRAISPEKTGKQLQWLVYGGDCLKTERGRRATRFSHLEMVAVGGECKQWWHGPGNPQRRREFVSEVSLSCFLGSKAAA
jgi:hypothetical protein